MFAASDSCNLHYIKHIEEIEFKNELEKSPETLSIENASAYFKIVLAHFRHQIKTETKHLILKTLYKILCKPDFLNVFVTKGFTPALPFSHKDVIDDIFKILYLLVTKVPNSFDEFVGNSFSKLVFNRGLKSLIILSIYFDNNLYRIGDISEEYKNPDIDETKIKKYANYRPMLRILLDQKERFMKPDICVQYAALISHIICKYPCLCGKDPSQNSYIFGLDAFEVLTQLLLPSEEENENIESERARIISIYSYLCKISAKIEECELPCQIIREHLKDQYLCTPALELLLVSKYAIDNDEEMANEGFIQSLLRIANSGNRLALLVLLRLAKNRNDVAQKLVEKPAWMEKCKKAHQNAPPEKVLSYVVDTLRLFLVVFNHKNLRDHIVSDNEFLIFLTILVETQEPDLLTICLQILRRVENLTKDFIEDIDECEFVSKFIEYSKKYDSIVLIDTIGKNMFSKDVWNNCSFLKDCLEQDEKFDAAATAAIDLCKFKKYRDRLKSLGVPEIFKKKSKEDQKKRNKAEMFFRQFESNQDVID